MNPKTTPSAATIRRLSLYLQCLNTFESKGETVCSSYSLAEALHLNPAQVRKDLTYFGEFGKRGVGYSIPRLKEHIIKILGLHQIRKVGIVGAGGRLGMALAMYKGFEKRNFKVKALFDIDPTIVGKDILGIGKVHHVNDLPKVVKREGIEILILTVPVEAAQKVFEIITLSTVSAVLNFAPIKLPSTPQLHVHNVDLALELEALSYYLNRKGSSVSAQPPSTLDSQISEP